MADDDDEKLFLRPLDAVARGQKREQTKNVLFMWICKLRSFLNQDSTSKSLQKNQIRKQSNPEYLKTKLSLKTTF